MKRIILTVITLTLLAGGTIAQNAEIKVLGTPTDVSGTEVTRTVSVSTYEHIIDFSVDNLTGSTKTWGLSRIRLTPSIGWTDAVCWGNSTYGECNSPSGDSFTTGYAIDVPTTASDALINVYITAPTGGSSSFRYFILDGSTKVDSVDLTITKVAGINENSSLTLIVAPNPATNFVNVSMEGVSSANLKIVDVLGNVVLKETVYESSKKVDVTRFKNGIYFITVDAEGIKPITRKLIIRH